MKKILTILIIIAAMVFCLTACRESSAVVQNPNQPEASSFLTTYAARFDYYWRALNSHYVFWDIDKTDWDAVYSKYLPMFEDLDRTVSAAPADKRAEVINSVYKTALQYYTDLSGTLIDHHMKFIVFDPYNSNNAEYVYSRAVEVSSRDYYHSDSVKVEADDGKKLTDWNEKTEIVNYFAEGGAGSGTYDGYKSAVNLMDAAETAVRYLEKYNPETGEGEAVTDKIVSDYCVAYDITIDKQNSSAEDMHVAYLAMSNYMAYDWLGTYYRSPEVCPSDAATAFKWKAGKTLDTFFILVCKYYKEGSLAGILMDNRANGGGYNVDLYWFIGMYADDDVTIAYTKYKEGFGKTDYSSEVPHTIDFQPNYKYYCNLAAADIPYVVLCDINSISNGEIVTAGITATKTGYSIGERTWGGTGALMGSSDSLTYTYGGEFGNKTAGPVWVYTSTWNARTFTRNGYVSLEGKGVTPDKEIYFKSTGEDNFVADVQTMLKSQFKEAFSYISRY